MKDYSSLGLNPYFKKEGSLPLRPQKDEQRFPYIPTDVTFETGGTVLSPVLVNPSIQGGTISGTVFGTIADVTGGTFTLPTIGSPTITGGNYNTGTFAGTPVITGAAQTGGSHNSAVFGSPIVTGGNWTTGTFAGTPVITEPDITGGTHDSAVFGTPTLQTPTVDGTPNLDVLAGSAALGVDGDVAIQTFGTAGVLVFRVGGTTWYINPTGTI